MDTHNFKYIITFLLLILFIGGCSQEKDTSGCPYPDSCNYNPDGIEEDNCWYAEEGCLCEDGEGSLIDNNGVCCNSSELDDCNICFGLNASMDDCGICNGANEDMDNCGTCFGSGAVYTEDWTIQIIGRVQPWSLLDWVSNEENYFGVSEYSFDGYDFMDIPDPPIFDTNWIKVYFHHPEWDSAFGYNFTTEMQSNSFCGIKEWNLFVEANSQGPLEFEFIFNNVPQNIEIEVIEEAQATTISDNSIIESTLEANVLKEFLIKVSIN